MRYADPKFVSDPGQPIEVVYAPRVKEDGSIELVESGVRDTDAEIQSYKDGCDISVILNRCANGDFSGLNARTGMYGDFTQMPKTYAEFLQLKIDSSKLFYSLPVEVRQKFDNDENKFFAQSGTEDWYKNIEGILPDDVRQVVFPAVTKVEESGEGE